MDRLFTACWMARRTSRSRVGPRALFMAKVRVAMGGETAASNFPERSRLVKVSILTAPPT